MIRADSKNDLAISEIFQAYYDCRKTKRNTWNALQFEQRLERNLMDLYYDLVSGEYEPGRSICFVVTYPKAREVWAANFRDRIVHHLLYNRYSDKFYRSFIFDSYACIPGKGTLNAASRVQHFMRSATINGKPAWYMKADVANFFVSIDKHILDRLLAQKITDPWWMGLTRKILHNNPCNNVHIKSPQHLLDMVPRHKSLFNSVKDCGLPIGNLSSQFFANVYMNELDQYAKHVLKLKNYVRYVDDIVVIGDDGRDLNDKYDDMAVFVKNALNVRFHPNKKEINKVEHGVNFVGFIIKPYCKYIRKSTVRNAYIKISDLERSPALRASVNSYLGMFRCANAYNERVRIAKYLGKRGAWFNGKLTKMVLKRQSISQKRRGSWKR